MAKTDYPITQAVRFLRDKNIAFEPHIYDYEEKGGTQRSSAQLGVDEHMVVKTLVMEDESRKAFIILMHGDYQVSTKQMARLLNVKSVKPCDPNVAQKHTGYMVGGTSPFGTKARLPVYAEKTIFELPKIYINGGKRGFLVEINPQDLHAAFPVVEVEVAMAS
jgi:Cys-tRNA(Pro) deacylase